MELQQFPLGCEVLLSVVIGKTGFLNAFRYNENDGLKGRHSLGLVSAVMGTSPAAGRLRHLSVIEIILILPTTVIAYRTLSAKHGMDLYSRPMKLRC